MKKLLFTILASVLTVSINAQESIETFVSEKIETLLEIAELEESESIDDLLSEYQKEELEDGITDYYSGDEAHLYTLIPIDDWIAYGVIFDYSPEIVEEIHYCLTLSNTAVKIEKKKNRDKSIEYIFENDEFEFLLIIDKREKSIDLFCAKIEYW